MAERWWSLAALTLARAGMGFQFQSVAVAAPLAVADLGLDKTQLGWLVGLYLVPGVAFALPGGLLGARFGDKRLVLAGLAFMAAGGVWLSLSGSMLEASIARLISGIGAVMLNVLVTKMVADLFEGKERLLAMSILINSWPIGIGLALWIVGSVTQAAGWRSGIASTVVFSVIGFTVVAFVFRGPTAAAPAVRAEVGIGVLTRREWQLLFIAGLPWMFYNAAHQIMVSFLPSFFVEGGASISRAGQLVALNTVVFVVARCSRAVSCSSAHAAPTCSATEPSQAGPSRSG